MHDTSSQDILYQQETDFELLELLLPFVQLKTFIDIGAEKGSFTRFLSSKGFHGSYFEPLPDFIPELQKIAVETGCQFFPFAIDSKDGSADFYTAFDHKDSKMSYFSTMHPLNGDSRINHKKTTTVVCRSLDSLLQENVLSNEVGIIKIDTEGNDLNVLKGMKNIKPEIIICEYFMPGIYSGWELGHPVGIINEVKSLGFNNYFAIKRIDELELVSINNSNFIEKQWGNLIFFNDSIFEAAKEKINNIIDIKEVKFFRDLLALLSVLRETNQERLALINKLHTTCEDRLTIIKTLQNPLKNKINLKSKIKSIFSHLS